jgi:hypothetical protein
MKITRTLGAFALSALLAGSALANTVAITEFLNNGEGEDSGREWLEIFNYGQSSVNLNNWTLTDEGSDSFKFPNVTIPSGGYLVLVTGGSSSDLTESQAKAVFEQEYLGGVADSRVLGMSPFALGNSGDELILSDAGSNVVWSLAYGNDETQAVATFLTGDDFGTTMFGSEAAPGVVRNGDDNGLVGFLGYEENTNVVDPFAFSSTITGIKDATFLTNLGLATDFYDNVDDPSVGSPLAGGYSVVPEPATLGLLVLGGLTLIRRR